MRITRQSTHAKHYALLTLCAFLFSCVAIITKKLTSFLPSNEIVFLRFATGLVLLFPFFLLKRKDIEIKRPSLLALRGFVGALSVMFYFAAIAEIPVSVTTLFTQTSPLFTVLFGFIILSEIPRQSTLLFGLVSLCGCFIMAIQRTDFYHLTHYRGIVFACFSSILTGLSVVLTRQLGKTEHPFVTLGSLSIVSMLFSSFTLSSWKTPPPETFVPVLFLGFVSVLGQLIFIHLLRHLSAAVATLSAQLVVVFSWLIAWLYLGEQPSWAQAGGAMIAVLGVIGVQISSLNDKPEQVANTRCIDKPPSNL